MADPATVLGQCIAVQFRPVCPGTGNPPVAPEVGRSKRAHAIYRSLRNLTRSGTLPRAVANAVRSRSAERGRGSSPASPAKSNSRDEIDSADERRKSLFIDYCMNDLEINGENFINNVNSNPPDIIQSTPTVAKNGCSEMSNGSACVESNQVLECEDEPFATLKKSSPSRRSSFFHAIHASLPPVCSAAAKLPPSARSSPFKTNPAAHQCTSPRRSSSSENGASHCHTNIATTPSSPNRSLYASPAKPSTTKTYNSTAPAVKCHAEILNGKPPQGDETTSGSGTPTPTNATTSCTNASQTFTNSSQTPTDSTLTPINALPTPTNALPSSTNTVPSSTNASPPPVKSNSAPSEPSAIFQRWVNANSACVWDVELVEAVASLKLVGALLGGWLLVSGPTRALATVLHAHTHSLLHPPVGYSIHALGEVSGCRITPVQKGQFTPLGPALCWVLHAEGGSNVSMRDLRDALIHHFPSLIPPDEETTHAALTELIKQRRIFHAGKGYSLVTPGTYGHSATLPDFAHHPPFRLMTTSEALTRAHGAAEVIPAGSITHAAVQTDLADLLTHHNHPAPDDGDARAASLRSGKLGTFVSTTAIATYFGKDLTDISVRVDRSGSMLSKLLRVSSPRMGSFSAQFPPPEWSRANTCQRHGHCRATQTPLVTQLAAAPEDTATASSQWVSRSSSLPRRHARPLSSTFHAAPEVLSNGPSPSHRHRHRSPSPSHALQGGCTSHNAAYSNPYQNMALHNQHNKQQQDEFACNKQALHGNYSIYGYAIDGLPPRPPIPSSIHYDFMHRRTLSASPRRMVGALQQNAISNHHVHHASPQRREGSRTLPLNSSIPAAPEGGSSRHALSSSHDAVYEPQASKHDHVQQHHTNAHPAQAIPFLAHRIKPQVPDGSPNRPGVTSPYKTSHTIYQSPNQQTKTYNLNTSMTDHMVSNLSSSIDSGILPDQRSSHRDSSEDRTRSATTSEDQNYLLDCSDEFLIIEVTNESQKTYQSQLEVRSRSGDRKSSERTRAGSLENVEDKNKIADKINKGEVEAGRAGPSRNKSSASKSNTSDKNSCFGSSPTKIAGGNKTAANKMTMKYNRAALQLDLVNSHTKRMAAQRQEPHPPPIQNLNKYSKTSARDLTTKNLGYKDTNKCDKKMYIAKQHAGAPCERTLMYSRHANKDTGSPSKNNLPKSKLENKASEKKKEGNIAPVKKVESNKITQKPCSPSAPSSKSPVRNLLAKSPVPAVETVGAGDNNSVRTYPSLSELNFSSLAAQKILRGVSINSIDTLLEVNIAAGEVAKPQEPVTNTDFGYL
ncbi:uncharacterized protein LOC108675008 [Hyalella azteca]|uniref:Uncharacterized protein LOC108675008 n=1 Tax=Hyalella azteca TaxID=294128 RepID=A0A8B7NXF6_HYAAZ|nr:uncharacterized protein LOC108675008 [Hyalella azteca]XP_047737685.1 uncharacterized protein LOC108675008 [Hyalella azteca]XP_047737686.1 uncharacterized protein LOC108675008 [Hyalella azteca]